MLESMAFVPQDPNFEARVRASFDRQGFMTLLNAHMTRCEPGLVEIVMPFSATITQQHGFAHAAATTAILDSACGFAALTLMPEGAEVLSVEFKVNLLSPAVGESFRAVGRVTRAGRTITVCQGEVFAMQDNQEKSVAIMTATMMRSQV
jgi:uncharacterized protein (TIGR00369 family)